jgi:cation diffusion facilitator CzcD-associated flavoprotein CzcO
VVPREFLGRSAQESSILLSKLPEPLADRLTRFVTRFLLPDVTDLGLERPAFSVRHQVLEQGKIPLIDIGTIDLIRQGAIKLVPGIEGFTRDGVRFADGAERPCDAVILATGYRAALGALVPDADSLLDARGYPRLHGARDPARPGLFFIGFANPITGALREAAIEARRIAGLIAENQATGVC